MQRSRPAHSSYCGGAGTDRRTWVYNTSRSTMTVKRIIAALNRDMRRAHVGCLGLAEGHDLAVHPLYRLHGVRVVRVDHNQAVLGREQAERMERVDDVVKILKKSRWSASTLSTTAMVGAKDRKELQYSHDSATKQPWLPMRQGSADGGQIAADHDSRVQRSLHGDECHHRGGGRLAVRARQADDVLVVGHQAAPGLRALHDRDSQFVRADDLGIVVVHGGRAG